MEKNLKRPASNNDDSSERDSKKTKTEESHIQNILDDLFEMDPATDKLDPPATEEEIKKLEETLGYTMPNSFKQLVKFCNGGQLRKRFFKLEDGSYAVIGYISGIYDEPQSVLQSKEQCEQLEIGSGYAILSGTGPEFFALDFTTNELEPAVISILQENNGIKITKLAPNFESFLTALEYREDDCYVIVLKSTVPIEELEATIITKLRDANVEVKTEEEIQEMRLLAFQNELEGSDEDDDEDDSDDSDDGDGILRELGARTNEVRDIGGSNSSDEEDAENGEVPEHVGDDSDDEGHFDFGDGNVFGFADSEDEDDENLKQCSLEALNEKEYPKEAKQGFNILFTYAMLKDGPFDDDVLKIKTVLESISGIDAMQITCEPLDGNLIKHSFC